MIFFHFFFIIYYRSGHDFVNLYPNPNDLDGHEDVEDLEDIDAKEDPIYRANIEKSLSECVSSIMKNSSLNQIFNLLSENDKKLFSQLVDSHLS